MIGSPSVLDSILDNLNSTLDPRDQLASDIRMYRNMGMGDPVRLLQERLSQIHPWDQEAQQIQDLLRGPVLPGQVDPLGRPSIPMLKPPVIPKF